MLMRVIIVLSVAAAAGICAWGGGFAGLSWLWRLPLGFAGSFLALIAAAFLVLWISCAFVRLDREQTQDSPYFRFLMKLYTPAILSILLTRVEASGLEKTPQSGRFLLVCNHLSDLDPVVLMSHFPDSQLAFISKRENQNMFIVGKVMHRLLCQMINRENDREALKTIIRCINLVQEDKVSIAVFPEGYTSLDHLLHHFRNGVFKIAQRTKIPIVVCTVQGTEQILHNVLRLRPTRVKLHLLDVMEAEEYAHLSATEIGTRVHDLMARDLGPDRVAES